MSGVLEDGTDRILMSIYGAQEMFRWHKAKVTLNETAAMSIEFLMTSNGQGLFSNIALDDISLRAGSCGKLIKMFQKGGGQLQL